MEHIELIKQIDTLWASHVRNKRMRKYQKALRRLEKRHNFIAAK